ncbi:MAG: hypothetical protein GXO63_02040 [Candidatus Micrarchaeota archaeon]|nr:hypothetical protein [Candidatus Micrarchaeota archaeon]
MIGVVLAVITATIGWINGIPETCIPAAVLSGFSSRKRKPEMVFLSFFAYFFGWLLVISLFSFFGGEGVPIGYVVFFLPSLLVHILASFLFRVIFKNSK